MREDTVVQLRQPGSFEDDPLTEVLRLGARRLLGQAVEAEVAGFVEAYAHLTGSAGRRRIVRHGHLPEREIQTGIGPVAVRCPRVRDRGAGETGRRVFRPPPLRPAVAFSQQGRAPRGDGPSPAQFPPSIPPFDAFSAFSAFGPNISSSPSLASSSCRSVRTNRVFEGIQSMKTTLQFIA